ncbi:MAG TPA: PTS sugar transporter subunit IIA [Cellulomonas sp.]|nr:PTS sugar transporter subunit IIA [Cellulomonas sp.]HEX5331826.1 PTS sugar transporter subunit IIA [Cellulomonas sp.]
MREILTRDLIVAAGAARTKDEAIREAGALLVGSGAVTPAYVEAMLQREETVSTYMGSSLAIPHGTNEAKESILHSAVSLVRYENPVDFGQHLPRAISPWATRRRRGHLSAATSHRGPSLAHGPHRARSPRHRPELRRG